MSFASHYTISMAVGIGLTRGLAREIEREQVRVTRLHWAPSWPMVLANSLAASWRKRSRASRPGSWSSDLELSGLTRINDLAHIRCDLVHDSKDHLDDGSSVMPW